MREGRDSINSVDEYIMQFPVPIQEVLQELRRVIKDSAPEADEKMSYQIPTYYLQGNLVHFAAYKDHVGFYPTPTGIEKFKAELEIYKGAKGSVQFPINKPLPLELIKRIIEFRVDENKKQTKEKIKKIDKEFAAPRDYIEQQPNERQAILESISQTIKDHLPNGFKETIHYGMIGYVVPLTLYPKGYHVNPEEPLPFISLANHKGHIALYHQGIYADKSLLEWFVKSYEELNIGKLDMGKSCIRFKNFKKIPYELIGKLCSKLSVEDYIHLYELSRPHK